MIPIDSNLHYYNFFVPKPLFFNLIGYIYYNCKKLFITTMNDDKIYIIK